MKRFWLGFVVGALLTSGLAAAWLYLGFSIGSARLSYRGDPLVPRPRVIKDVSGVDSPREFPSTSDSKSEAAENLINRATTSALPAIALVNVQGLLAAILPDGASPLLRLQTIHQIERATHSRAVAHHFSLVIDVSAKSLNHEPIVSGGVGAFDLTEEVRHELTK